jgi:outer membrane protein assembly factor BamB
VKKACFGHNGYSRKCTLCRGRPALDSRAGCPRHNLLFCCFVIISSGIVAQVWGQSAATKSLPRGRIENALIVTQLPPASNQRTAAGLERQKSAASWFMGFGEGARLVKVYPDSSIEELSRDFHSACDPAISFDASHILFAGKRTPGDDWNIYEMEIDGSNVRQITNGIGNCRSPYYQAMLYTIVSPEPWYQLTFVGIENGVSDEYGAGTTTNLYSCKLDGSEVRRLTFNLSGNMDPFVMSDGRLLFASRHRSALNPELYGGISLFGINIDGTDYAVFHADMGKRIKRMPCATTKGLVVFVESDELRWDGAGGIGSTLLRRPLNSYRQITRESDGLFHSPSALADGRILVSRRSQDDTDTHGVYRLDPYSGQLELIYDSPGYHDIQAKMIYPRPEPDGRSSVVAEKDPNGKLYCLDVYISDFDKPEWMSRGTVKRLRVLEGVLSAGTECPGVFRYGQMPLVQRRILGEIEIEQDGSFNIEIPANTPIELQTLDADGIALRSCGWIWAKNHEPRGCIGCHEDGELTPENVLVKAVTNPSVKLNLPVEQRRTVDFQRDVMPIIAKKCVRCHSRAVPALRLTDDLSSAAQADDKTSFNRSYESLLTQGDRPDSGKYVHPGRARTSLLIWRIFGRNTSRPWDDTFSRQKIPRMPPDGNDALTKDEKRTFAEWIDLGALWNGIPGPDNMRESQNDNGGSSQ